MSSPEPVAGLPLHTRSLTVSLKPRPEGGWLARGDVIDLRKNGFVPTSYDIQPAGVIHSMNIELDLDPETLRMDAIRVEQPFVAVEPSAATGGECCRDPAPRLLTLTGERFDDAFPGKLSATFGGTLGCSHLLTLFQLMASTIPHAAAIERARAMREGTQPGPDDRFFRRAVFVDGLRGNDGRIDVSILLTDSATRPALSGTDPLQRVEHFHETKIATSVVRRSFLLERLAIHERTRDADSLGEATWHDRTAPFASLVDQPIVPGLAKRVFGLTDGQAALGESRDALLMFAPGYLQIMAAVMDEWIEQQAQGRVDENASGGPRGGSAGSCYMWRDTGPIAAAAYESRSKTSS